MTWRLRVLAVLLGLLPGGHAAGAAELVLRVSEGWAATRLATDAPQTPILEFGDQYALPSGELVFWGRIRDGSNGWALFSLQGDRVRTILAEGERSVSRYGEPGLQVHLHYQGDGFLHRATRILAGRALVLSTEEKIALGGSVYAWDGERLRGILVQGERTTLGGAGVLAGAFAWAGSPDGLVLLTLRTKKPDPYSAWALYDGATTRLLARSGQALRGLTDVQAGELCSGGSGGVCKVQLFDGGQVLAAISLVRGGSEAPAIVLLALGGSEILLSRGGPFPGDPAKTIDTLAVESAESPRRFVALLFAQDTTSKGGPRVATYARCDGGDCTPSSDERANSPAADELAVPWPSARALRWSGQWRENGTERIGRLDLVAELRDGELVQLTRPSLLLDEVTSLRLIEGEIPGAIIDASAWDTSAAKNGYVDTRKLSVRSHPGRWFVAADDLAAGFQPLPMFRTVDGRSVSVADVLVRKGTGEVLAWIGEGLYRLDRAAEPSPH